MQCKYKSPTESVPQGHIIKQWIEWTLYIWYDQLSVCHPQTHTPPAKCMYICLSIWYLTLYKYARRATPTSISKNGEYERRLRLTQSQLPSAVTKIYLHFRLNAFLFYFYRPTWLLLFVQTRTWPAHIHTHTIAQISMAKHVSLLATNSVLALLLVRSPLALVIMLHFLFDFFLFPLTNSICEPFSGRRQG